MSQSSLHVTYTLTHNLCEIIWSQQPLLNTFFLAVTLNHSLVLTMQSVPGVLLTIFLSPLFSVGHSTYCDPETQYEQFIGNDKRCCDKCKPGERLVERCSATGPTRCEKCREGYYSDRHDVEWRCQGCRDCSMNHLVYQKNCTPTENTVCSCVPGYRCSSEPCLDCIKIAGPAAEESLTPSIEVSSETDRGVTPGTQHKEEIPSTPGGDGIESGKEVPASSMGFSHIALIVCPCILLICALPIFRNQTMLWIRRTRTGFRIAKKADAPRQCTEEEGKMPIQEVCEKLDLQEHFYV